MKKIFTFIVTLFLPVLFLLSGCSSSKQNDMSQNYIIVKNSSRFEISTENFILVYESGEKLAAEKLKISFDDRELSSDEYFLTTNDEKPLNAKLDKDATLNGTYDSQQYQFYVAYQLDEERKIFVSSEITVTVTNKNGSNKIVYLIISLVVILAVGFALFMRSKYQKDKKDSGVIKKKFYEDYEPKEQKQNNKDLYNASKNDDSSLKDNPFITSFKKKEEQENNKK